MVEMYKWSDSQVSKYEGKFREETDESVVHISLHISHLSDISETPMKKGRSSFCPKRQGEKGYEVLLIICNFIYYR